MSRLWNGAAAAAAAGAVFAVVLVVAAGIAGAPSAEVDPASGSDDIATAFVDGSNNLVTGNYVLLLSAFLLIVFVAYLRSVIGPTTSDAWPATVGLGGGLLVAGVLSFVALIGVSQGELSDYGSEPVIAKTLLILGWNGIWMTVPGFAALTGGMSLMAVKYETLPTWLGWLGAAVTVVLLTPLWGPGFIGALLWIAVVSVLLTLQAIRADGSESAETSVT